MFIRVPSPNLPGACPPDIDETAEAFIMKRLSAADALDFAIHCLGCHQCATAAAEAEAFVCVMKAATRKWNAEARHTLRLSSCVSFSSITVLPRGCRARMRFEVTVCEVPRTCP